MSDQTETLLLVVEDAFLITGRGLVLAPEVNPQLISSEPIKTGYVSPVRLVRPDGSQSIVEATFYWEHFNTRGMMSGFHFMCVLRETPKEDVPPGTQVWLITT